MRRSLFRWLFEPIALPIWGTVLLSFTLFAGSMLWIEHLTPITEASFCFMDAVLWVDGLIDYWYNGEMEWDRPPLSLWMGAWLLSFGYTEVQALQLVSRMALSVLMTIVTVGLLRWTSLVITLASLGLILGTPSFSRLMLWLNAEMLVNSLFVIHLFVGWYAIDIFHQQKPLWKKRISLIITGLLAGLTVCAKEQGILLLPISVLLISLLSQKERLTWFKTTVQRMGWYLFGSIGPLAWYGTHFIEQWQQGEKWQLFLEDLNIIFSQDSLSDRLSIKTSWGTFSRRFGEVDSWWDFFHISSSTLLQEMLVPTLYVIGTTVVTALISFGWNQLQRGEEPTIDSTWKIKWREGIWILGHVIPVLPLLLVPIFEPYHYTVMWTPVVILLAWTTQQWLTRWKVAGVLPLILMGYILIDGESFNHTVKLERERCITTRLRNVRMWMRKNAHDRATLWVTDSLTPYDRALYPHRAKAFSGYSDCSPYDYVATSGLSNQASSFIKDRTRHPEKWTKVHSIVSINKEHWQIFQSVCHKRIDR